jgi:hypothetical protein
LSNHILFDGAPGLERGHIKGQAIYFSTGPWPREGAYQKSNHIFLDGVLAPRGGRIKGRAKTPDPHGPVYKYEAGPMRPRSFMDPHINSKDC